MLNPWDWYYYYSSVPQNSSKTKSFIVTNRDSIESAVVDRLYLHGRDSVNFRIQDPEIPFILPPGEAKAITVAFKPVSFGFKRALLRVESSDPNAHPFDIALSGYAIAVTSGSNIWNFLGRYGGWGVALVFVFILMLVLKRKKGIQS